MLGFLIEEQCFGFGFCFRLRKTASETPEMLRTLSLTKPMLVHTHLCDSDLEKLQLKTVIVRTSLHGSCKTKRGGSFQNVHRRPMKYRFGDGWTWGGSPRGLCLGCTPISRSSSHFRQLATWLWAPPSLLAWFGPLKLLLVSGNTISATKVIPEFPWNSGRTGIAQSV